MLTDEKGLAVAGDHPRRLEYTLVAAGSAEEAIRSLLGEDVEIDRMSRVGTVQAMATVRRGRSAMMLHAFPEGELDWRAPGARSVAKSWR